MPTSLPERRINREPVPLPASFYAIINRYSSVIGVKIPPSFIEEEYASSGVAIATLEGDNGREWNIILSKAGDDFSLKDGFATFMRENSLENFDIVVFTYKGNLKFDVQVFDKDGTIKRN